MIRYQDSMKIVFLSRRYLPHLGGVEKHLEQLNRQLLMSPEEHRITVVTEQDSQTEPRSEIQQAIHIRRIELPHQKTDKLTIWRWLFWHRQLLFSTDIIHIHDVFFWILPLYPWLKLLNKKIFITFHGYEGPGNPSWRQRTWHQLAAALTNGNICIGGFHQKWYGVTPTITSFGGVEIARQKVKHRVNHKLIHILYLGRLSDDLGIMKYLAAIKVIAARHSVRLDVYGDGPNRQAAQSFVSKHRLPVTFCGYIPSKNIKWQTYDLAFVSGYLSILEAMIAGLPIIAQYHAPIKYDYLKNTPFSNWIEITGSTEEIIASWQRATSPKFQHTVKQAQTWANKQTWQKLANQYLELWQKN